MRGLLDVAVHPRNPGSVEGTAHRILQGRQFRQPGKSLLERALDWLVNELEKLLPSGSGGTLSLPSWVGLLILGAIVAVVIVLLVRAGAFRRRRRPEPESPVVHEAVEELGVPGDEWLRRAQAAEQEGRFTEGVRCRYRASLALLTATGAVAERVGRTAGSYRRRVDEAAPIASDPFGQATERFEQAWYGQRPAGPDDRDVMAGLHAQIEEAARQLDIEASEDEPVGAGSTGR